MMKKLLFILAVVILGISCSSDSKEDNVVSYSVRIIDDYTLEGTLPSMYKDEFEFLDSVIKVLRKHEVHFGIYNVIAEKSSEADKLVTSFVQSQIDKFPTEELMEKFGRDDFEFICTYGAYRYDNIVSNLKVYIPLKLRFSTKTGAEVVIEKPSKPELPVE